MARDGRLAGRVDVSLVQTQMLRLVGVGAISLYTVSMLGPAEELQRRPLYDGDTERLILTVCRRGSVVGLLIGPIVGVV
jgi:hypothetical protein